MILKNKREFTNAEKDSLWEQYAENPEDKKVFNLLLEAYLPLVEIIASKMKSKLPPEVEIGDLVNDGFFGLVDALNKFDVDRGWKFETYASNRVRGEINDRLRDYDWVSRYSRLKFKLVSQTEAALVEELQREPTAQEVANRLGWNLEELSKVKSYYSNSFAINIDDYITDSTHESFSLAEMIPDQSLGDIDFDLQMDDLASTIQKHLFSLSEHESIILYLVIYESMSFNEIAETLEVKSSKINKIYNEAIHKLQERLGVV